MHVGVCDALAKAIEDSLPIAQKLADRCTEPHLVWRRTGDRQWSGGYEERPSLATVLIEGRPMFEKIDAEFLSVFSHHYPEYGGMVGLPSLGRMRILQNPAHILSLALSTIWQRHHSFRAGNDVIAKVVAEFGEFIDCSKVRFKFLAELVNFHMPLDSIELPFDLRIRRLSETEVSEMHGGPLSLLGIMPSRGFAIREFAIEGDHEEPKCLGEPSVEEDLVQQRVRPKLDRAMLMLRTFKEGRVGYDFIRFKSVSFSPLQVPSFTYGDLYIPFGNYELAAGETDSLREHAACISPSSKSALETACLRLSDAQMRLRPQDRLVDAVIGLEALLLAGLAEEDRRGELKFRFSLHYSTLFNSPAERHQAFRVAKDLYDVRSTIAHGGVVKDRGCRLGEEWLGIEDVANRACEALRGVVKHFLRCSNEAPYKNPRYWERSYFGLDENLNLSHGNPPDPSG